MAREWRDSATELAVWWSIWTLADTYLIPFTPWSEIAVLVLVVVAVKFKAFRDWIGKRYATHATHVQVAIDRI